MKKYTLLILIFTVPLILSAQKWDTQFGKTYKRFFNKGLGKKVATSEFMGVDNQSYFLNGKSKKKNQLLQFDFNHNLINSIPIGKNSQGKKLKAEYILKTNNGNYLISSYHSKRKKQTWVYATRIHEDGTMEMAKDHLFSYPSSQSKLVGIKNADSYGYDISPDSSKIVFTSVFRTTESSDVHGYDTYKVFVFNQDLSKSWEREIRLPNVDRKIQVKQFGVTNGGDVFILADNQLSKRERKRWVPRKDILLIRINDKEKYELNTLRLQKSFPISAAVYTHNEELLLMGFYTNGKKQQQGLDGIFMMRFDEQDELKFTQKYPLDEKIKNDLKPNRRKKSDLNFYHFEIKDLLIDHQNNHIVFIGENRYYSDFYQSIVSDDLIISRLSFDGHLEWILHKKKELSGVQGSYGLSYQGENIFLIYNTSKTRKERETFNHVRSPDFTSFYTDVIKINGAGEIYFEETLFHSRDRQVRPQSSLSWRIKNGDFLIFFGNAHKFQYCTIRFK